MKKFLAFIMVLAMLLSLAACGAKAPAEEAEPIPEDIMNQPAAPGEGPLAQDMPTADANMGGDTAGALPAGESLGESLKADFLSLAEADPGLSAGDLMNGLMASPSLSFGPVTMDVEPGLLTGFGNAEITGFEQGVIFAPMIGSIPFVGYVFRVAEGGDAQALADLLEANADPRWNICTEAEQTVVAVSGQLVFFVMCPYSLEG